jgi:hypothetical protein
MRRTAALILWAALLAPACAQERASDAMPVRGDLTPGDYAKPENWICRPGVDDGTCSTNLDAMAVDAKGERTPAPFVAATDPAIDCFYIYPTASDDPTLYSDLKADASERRPVHGQAARLRAACRLFAPVYHSFTMAALRWSTGHDDGGPIDFDPPYRDVVAAWRAYLKNDNKGRGVVLVGHSQGAILLKRLIAEEIDGKPAQKLLVGAYLAGNLDLSAKSFKAIPPCAANGQTGCVVAWSSYNADYAYVETIGQISAECVADAKGAALRIRVEPDGKYADMIGAGFKRLTGAWGMHTLDISLVQGNMVDLIAAQSAAWKRK